MTLCTAIAIIYLYVTAYVYTIPLYIQQLVRVSLAENIATLAETAVRFLELSQVAASAEVQVSLYCIDTY